MGKTLLIICLIFLIEVTIVHAAEFTLACGNALKSLEIEYFVVEMEG